MGFNHSKLTVSNNVMDRYTEKVNIEYPSLDNALEKTLENNKMKRLVLKAHINNKIRDAIAQGQYYTTIIFNLEDWVHEPGQEGTDRFFYNLRREMIKLYHEGYIVQYELTDDSESYYCKIEWESQSAYNAEKNIKEGTTIKQKPDLSQFDLQKHFKGF